MESLEERVVPTSYQLVDLASFNTTNGANPYSSLLMDANGNLFGTANKGGSANDGTIFEVAHGSGTITVLASFNNANGKFPQGSLVMDAAGNLFGTTVDQTSGGFGTIFELPHGSSTIVRLANFTDLNATPARTTSSWTAPATSSA